MSKKLKNAAYQVIELVRDGRAEKRRVIVDDKNKLVAYGDMKSWSWIHRDFKD